LRRVQERKKLTTDLVSGIVQQEPVNAERLTQKTRRGTAGPSVDYKVQSTLKQLACSKSNYSSLDYRSQ